MIDLTMFTQEIDGVNVDLDRPETKGIDDVLMVVKKHASNQDKHWVIDRFVEMYLDGLQWDWYEEYRSWCSALHVAVGLMEDQTKDQGQYADEFVATNYVEDFYANNPEPIRPTILTVAEGRDSITIGGKTLSEIMFRESRAKKVANSSVTVAGMVFDADEDSQRRMLSAIAASDNLGLSTSKWTLADNTVVDVDKATLVEAHAQAIALQGSVWHRD